MPAAPVSPDARAASHMPAWLTTEARPPKNSGRLTGRPGKPGASPGRSGLAMGEAVVARRAEEKELVDQL